MGQRPASYTGTVGTEPGVDRDAVIDLQCPREFYALGMYYRHATPVTNDDLVRATAMVWGTPLTA